ncbi:DNA alkylation repair protein [Chakrabartyella piscis]|uniref:DNA alkylation repair protein n=1 Tax=Chakrabartyella piscis TaxID=2918914 RepID=UPI0029586F54|nr:DNA alkylation repair protein [Chakrabartyella piscis]
MTPEQIRAQLQSMAEEDYRIFSAKLIPNIDNVLGVRIPLLMKLAKELAKEQPLLYLESTDELYFEERMLKGLIICNLRGDLDFIFGEIEKFVPKIDNWSVCDSFCTHLKITKKYKPEVWQFLQQYRKSKAPYDLRFLLVMILGYYIEEAYLPEIFQIFDETNHEEYYVKMAVAWAISMCMVKFPEETFAYLEHHKLDAFTYRKALQKSLESTRVTKENKEKIRVLRNQTK